MADPILVCGPSDDEPDYDGINSPTGRCEQHGDYLYYCADCAALDQPEEVPDGPRS